MIQVKRFFFNCDQLVSSPDREAEGRIGLGPNPTQGTFWIRFQPETPGPYEILIYDLHGRPLLHRTGNALLREHMTFLELPGASPGIYLVEIKQKEKSYRERLIVH